MTVRELMLVLSQLDENLEVWLWNAEWGSKDPIFEIEVDSDGDVVVM